jgi:hypothetical protein
MLIFYPHGRVTGTKLNLYITTVVVLVHGTCVVGFSPTCAISAYHHKSCEFKPRSWRGVLDTT